MKYLLDMGIKVTILSIAREHSLPSVFYYAIGTMILGDKVMGREHEFIPFRPYPEINKRFFKLIRTLSANYPYISEFLETKTYEEIIDRKRIRLMEEVMFLFHNYREERLAHAILKVLDLVDEKIAKYWDFFVKKTNAQYMRADSRSCDYDFGQQR